MKKYEEEIEGEGLEDANPTKIAEILQALYKAPNSTKGIPSGLVKALENQVKTITGSIDSIVDAPKTAEQLLQWLLEKVENKDVIANKQKSGAFVKLLRLLKNINIQFNDGNTTLNKAILAENGWICKSLLKLKETDVTIKNRGNNVAADLIIQKKFYTIIRYLPIFEESSDKEDKAHYGYLVCHLIYTDKRVEAKNLLKKHKYPRFLILGSLNPVLHIAIQKHDYELVKALIKAGHPIDCKNQDGDTPIVCAAKTKQWHVINKIIKRTKASENDEECYGHALLLILGQKSPQFQLAEKILDICDPNLELYDAKKLYAIHYAVLHEKIEIIKKILKKNPKRINKKFSKNHNTPLTYAIDVGEISTETLTFLLEKTELNLSLEYKKKTALVFAIENRRFDLANILLGEKYKNKSMQNPGYYYAKVLFSLLAISAPQVDLALRVLRNHSISYKIDFIDPFGNSILHFAAQVNSIDLIKEFLEKKPSLINFYARQKKTTKGLTPLISAIDKIKPETLKRLLTYKNLDLDIKYKGKTALIWAIEKNSFEITKILVERSIIETDDSKKHTYYGTVLLNLAAKGGKYHGLAIHILERCRSTSLRRYNTNQFSKSEGCFAIHYAVQHNRIDLIKAILEIDPTQINKRFKSGPTPLFWAIDNECRSETIGFLLQQDNLDTEALYEGASAYIYMLLLYRHYRYPDISYKYTITNLFLRYKPHIVFEPISWPKNLDPEKIRQKDWRDNGKKIIAEFLENYPKKEDLKRVEEDTTNTEFGKAYELKEKILTNRKATLGKVYELKEKILTNRKATMEDHFRRILSRDLIKEAITTTELNMMLANKTSLQEATKNLLKYNLARITLSLYKTMNCNSNDVKSLKQLHGTFKSILEINIKKATKKIVENENIELNASDKSKEAFIEVFTDIAPMLLEKNIYSTILPKIFIQELGQKLEKEDIVKIAKGNLDFATQLVGKGNGKKSDLHIIMLKTLGTEGIKTIILSHHNLYIQLMEETFSNEGASNFFQKTKNNPNPKTPTGGDNTGNPSIYRK